LQDFANDSSQFAAPPHLVAFAHVCEKRWKRIRKLAAAASGDGHSHDHPSYCIFSMQKGQAGDVTVSELAIRAVEQARRTATEQHTVELGEDERPGGDLHKAWKKHCAARRTVTSAPAVYDMPIESPGALPEAVSRSEQRKSWKKFHTLAGTTRSMRMHVCACCELGQFETEMHSSLFTVKTLERAVRGLPAPGMECSRHRWETLTDEQCAVAATIGWTEGAWDGVDEPGDAVCQWLTGTTSGPPRYRRLSSRPPCGR
jgi:hypothetical protein